MTSHWIRVTTLAAVAAAAWASLPAVVTADTTPAADSAGAASNVPAWLDQVSVNGFLSASYSYNTNQPPSGTNQLRVFDFDDRTFKLDVFELVTQKPVAKPRDAGFRVDLTLGSSIPRVAASSGLFRDDSGQAEDIDLQQAFVSWIAPAGSGLRLDVGKFVTPCGYEVIDGYDGWNDQATRSLLFGYAIPFTHVGARAAYAVSPYIGVMGMVVNGWDVARDNNRSPSIGGQLALTPSERATLYVNSVWGPERPGNDDDMRTVVDVTATFRLRPQITLGTNLDWGSDANAVAPGTDGTWSGIAGYLRVAITPSFTLSARGESFDDGDGVRTGTAQTLSEYTLTPELRLTPHLLVRADARIDHSSQPVFEKPQANVDSQTTFLASILYSF